MNDARPAERDTVRVLSGLMILLLTLAWIGGTIGLFLAAVGESLCMEGCQEVSEHSRLLADRFTVGSVACACGFPLLAALVCMFTGRWIRAGVFVTLGVAAAVVYGGTFGVAAVRDIHRIELPTSVPVPRPNHCPCYSDGTCDCPGG